MSGKPAGSCVTTCHQMAAALGHLGFEAEPMAACATVFRAAGQVKYTDVGVWEHPPIVRPDGTTNGHMVVWTESFRRLIDATVVQDPALLKLARRDIQFTLPVVLRVPGGRDTLIDGQTAFTPRGPFLVSWLALPDWTETMTPLLDGPRGRAVEYGALAVAHDALDVRRSTGEHRDLRELPRLYPTLAALLTGSTTLPPLADELPPDVAQLLGR